MARKMNRLNLARAIPAASEISNRRPTPPVTALYLMQLRSHALKISPPTNRTRLAVHEIHPEIPQPVKIIHVG
jgi:hypothetical protein